MASGNPFSPSTTTIRTSSTPRAFNSFITPSQSFAPYCDAVHIPKISFRPSGITPIAKCAALRTSYARNI